MGLHRHDALLGFQRPDHSRHGAAIVDPQAEHGRPGDLQVQHLQAVEPMPFTQIVELVRMDVEDASSINTSFGT